MAVSTFNKKEVAPEDNASDAAAQLENKPTDKTKTIAKTISTIS
jgi:hypothetical protein